MRQSQYILKPQARHDVLDIFEYIAKDNRKAAEQFLDEMHETGKALAELPGMGTKRIYADQLLKDVRMFPVNKFMAYLIFYHEVPKGIEIIRIIHGARDLPALFK